MPSFRVGLDCKIDGAADVFVEADDADHANVLAKEYVEAHGYISSVDFHPEDGAASPVSEASLEECSVTEATVTSLYRVRGVT